MTRVKAWLRKHWTSIVGAMIAVMALLGLTQSLRARNEAKLDELARRRAEDAAKKVAALRDLRSVVAGRVSVRTERIRALDTRIAAAQREVVEAHERTEGLSDDEVLGRFRSLGYR